MKEFLKPPVKISLEHLLLDPDNPRFADNFDFAKRSTPISEIKNKQNEAISIFKRAPEDIDGGTGADRIDHPDRKGTSSVNESGTNFGLDSLIASIESIGFVPIDKPVVSKISGTDDYLVIEGNRRICSCKEVMRYHQQAIEEGDRKNKNYPLKDEVIKSISEIEVVELDLDGADEDERDKRIRVILGVRHHGSLLPWEPLPSAYNIYRKYMTMEPELTEFVYNNRRVKEVLEIFAIGDKASKKALAAYVAYDQLEGAGFKVKPDWFSLISELVTNAKLKSLGYLDVDSSTFKLSEDSLSKVNLLCQFENRDELFSDPPKEAKDKFKILKDPKSVKYLVKIVAAQNHKDESVKDFAKDLLSDLESEVPEERIPLETLKYHPKQGAVDALNEFLNSLKWVDQLEKLITQLNSKTKEGDAELKFEDFGGNDAIWLDNLDKQLVVFRRMYDIS